MMRSRYRVSIHSANLYERQTAAKPCGMRYRKQGAWPRLNLFSYVDGRRLPFPPAVEWKDRTVPLHKIIQDWPSLETIQLSMNQDSIGCVRVRVLVFCAPASQVHMC